MKPLSYMHPNSSEPPPILDGDVYRLVEAIQAGQSCEIVPNRLRTAAAKYVPEMIRQAADHIALRLIIGTLARYGRAYIIECPDRDYVEIACRVDTTDGVGHAFNGNAARRLLNRLESGMGWDAAIARTLEQCEQPTLSTAELTQREREADGQVRRMAIADEIALRTIPPRDPRQILNEMK